MHFDTEIRVRYAETDQMGVVYHANYFPWFEEARTNLMAEAGFSYREVEERGILFPLTECSCRYIAPARYFDWIVVRARMEQVKGIRFSIAYQVFRKEDGALLAEGRTAHTFVSRDFRPVNVLRVMPEVYGALKEMAAQPDQ